MKSSVYIVPSFHYDVVYLQDYQTYLERGFAILDRALCLLESSSEYCFLIEQVILAEAYCAGRPDRLAKLKRFTEAGRLHFAPGMYVMPDMNMPDGESLFLQISEGFRWLEEKLHYRPAICWIADCWGHPAQLPQILTRCGFKGYAFWRCMNPDLRKNHFLWRGIDGTTIRTHWLSKGYSPIHFPDTAEIVNAPDQKIFTSSCEQLETLCREFEEIGAAGHVLLCNGGDFTMPQESASATLAHLRSSGLFAKLELSGPEQYFDSLDWKNAILYDGEFNSALQGTFSSNIRLKQQIRECAFFFNALERLAVLTGRPWEKREMLLKQLLKQQFHDTICGTLADAPLNDTLRELAACLRQLEEARLELGSSAVPEKNLFNPTQFDRTEIIRDGDRPLLLSVGPHASSPQRTARVLSPDGDTSLPQTFTNGFYSARLDAEGFIASLKVDGGELVNPHAAVKFGALTMQMDYGDLWLHFDAPLSGGSPAAALTQNREDPLDFPDDSGLVNRGTFRPEIREAALVFRSPELWIVRQTGRLCFWQLNIDFTVETHFRSDSPRIAYRVEFTPKGKHYRIRAAFPSTVGADGAVYYEIPFGIQKRGRAVHAAQNWMDFSDADKGIALLNRGLPSNSVDSAGNLLLTLFRSAAMEYKAPSEESFGTGVRHNFEYAVVPHGKRNFAALVKEGILFNAPLLETGCRLPRAFVPEAENIMISAIRNSEDGVLLRLYECAGLPTTSSIHIPECFRSCLDVDGLGERSGGKGFPVFGTVPVELNPFEIKTLLLLPNRKN